MKNNLSFLILLFILFIIIGCIQKTYQLDSSTESIEVSADEFDDDSGFESIHVHSSSSSSDGGDAIMKRRRAQIANKPFGHRERILTSDDLKGLSDQERLKAEETERKLMVDESAEVIVDLLSSNRLVEAIDEYEHIISLEPHSVVLRRELSVLSSSLGFVNVSFTQDLGALVADGTKAKLRKQQLEMMQEAGFDTPQEAKDGGYNPGKHSKMTLTDAKKMSKNAIDWAANLAQEHALVLFGTSLNQHVTNLCRSFALLSTNSGQFVNQTHQAFEDGSSTLMRAFTQQCGVKPSLIQSMIDNQLGFGLCSRHDMLELLTACIQHQNVLRDIINSGASPVSQNDFGYTVLHHLALFGDESLVKTYFSEIERPFDGDFFEYGNFKRALINTLPTLTGATPLHLAVLRGNFHLIQYLISQGAQTTANDLYNRTPFDMAASHHFLSLSKTDAKKLFPKAFESSSLHNSDDMSLSFFPQQVLPAPNAHHITESGVKFWKNHRRPIVNSLKVQQVLARLAKPLFDQDDDEWALESSRSRFFRINQFPKPSNDDELIHRFIQNYLSLELPVLIDLSSHQVVRRLQTRFSLDNLISRKGDLKVTVFDETQTPLFLDPTSPLAVESQLDQPTLKEYIEQFILATSHADTNGLPHPMSLLSVRQQLAVSGPADADRSSVSQAFVKDVALLDGLLLPSGSTKLKNQFFWLAPPLCGQTMFAHSHSYDVLVSGRRHWFIYPPSQGIFSSLSVYEWIEQMENAPAPGVLSPIEFIQHPGEVVYIPESWSYAFINLETSVSLQNEIIWGASQFQLGLNANVEK